MERVINLFNRPIWNSVLTCSIMLAGMVILSSFSLQQLQKNQVTRMEIAVQQIQLQVEELLKQTMRSRSVQDLQQNLEENQFSNIVDEFALVGLIVADQAFYFAASDPQLVGKRVNSMLVNTLTNTEKFQSISLNYLGESQPFVQFLSNVSAQELNEQTLHLQILLRQTPFLQQQQMHLNWLVVVSLLFAFLVFLLTWVLNNKVAKNVRIAGNAIDQILEHQPSVDVPIDNHNFSILGQKLSVMHSNWKSMHSKIQQYKTDLVQNNQRGKLKEKHHKIETVGILLQLSALDKLLADNPGNAQETTVKILQILDATSKNFEGQLIKFNGNYALIAMKNKHQIRPAVQTALAVVSKLHMLDTMVEIPKGFELQVKIAIHSGPLFFGSTMQADKFYNYAVGELVDQLYYMLQFAGEWDVLVSSEISPSISDNFALGSLPKKPRTEVNDLNVFVVSQQQDSRRRTVQRQTNNKKGNEFGIDNMLEETLQDYTSR